MWQYKKGFIVRSVGTLLIAAMVLSSCNHADNGSKNTSDGDNMQDSKDTIVGSETLAETTVDETLHTEVTGGDTFERPVLKDPQGSFRLQILADKEYQTFETFGGSGGWWAQDVGSWTNIDSDSGLEVRERIAALLFDPVDGIGLTSYRYNLGGGSADSADEGIGDPWRRAHSLESEPGVYDWSRDEAAIWMMEEIVRQGATEVVIFANSPPERMKRNGKAYDDNDQGGNFPEEFYDDFAVYALDVAEHFISNNIPVKYISPVNEPNWQWTGGQEGVKLSAQEVVNVYRAFVAEMDKRPALADLKLSGTENIFTDDTAKQYVNAVMRAPEVTARMDHFANHTYGTSTEMKQSFGYWFKNAYPDFNYRMSEWTEMTNGRDTSMDSGLVMANTIFEDLTLLNVVGWQKWILVSSYDYRDGLIYVDTARKTLSQTKRLWVMGNYSRHIQAGDIRLGSHIDASTKVNVTSFRSPEEDRLVMVLVNNNEHSSLVRPELPAWAEGMEASFYVTSRTHNLEQLELEESGDGENEQSVWHLPPDSVVTVVLK